MSTAKTSQSHPLRIEPVEIRDGRGVIGLTFCPGKKHTGMISGAWDRDLRIDMKAIEDFGAAALVTLMEDAELDAVHVPPDRLRAEARERGIEWHYLPVADVDIPDRQFEDRWTYAGLRLRNILKRGGRVVVHCRGGLGRTGTIAARLLVEFGDDPKVAIKKVRAARPGTIETQAQENYVENCLPVRFARVDQSQEERALACLLGGAIGDAFGYAVEFSSLAEIHKKFGEGGIKNPVRHHGKLVVSDDTQMTLFTLEGLLRAIANQASTRDLFLREIRNSYLDWLDTQNGSVPRKSLHGWLALETSMRALRAPGNTCLSALNAGGNGLIEQPANDSKGCGGVMRVAPVALVGHDCVASAVFRLGAESAALTHGHPSGYLSAGVMAALVHSLLQGRRTKLYKYNEHDQDPLAEALSLLWDYADHEEMLEAVNRAISLARKGAADHPRAVESLGGGWVGEQALAIALYSVLAARSFVEAIIIATNHSGDSDSTASLAGQLWGAAHGLAGMPHDWIVDLDVLLPLLRLAKQLIEPEFR